MPSGSTGVFTGMTSPGCTADRLAVLGAAYMRSPSTFPDNRRSTSRRAGFLDRRAPLRAPFRFSTVSFPYHRDSPPANSGLDTRRWPMTWARNSSAVYTSRWAYPTPTAVMFLLASNSHEEIAGHFAARYGIGAEQAANDVRTVADPLPRRVWPTTARRRLGSTTSWPQPPSTGQPAAPHCPGVAPRWPPYLPTRSPTPHNQNPPVPGFRLNAGRARAWRHSERARLHPFIWPAPT